MSRIQCSIKKIFDEQIELNNEYSKIFFTVLGIYLINFNFIDSQWLEKKISKIFDKDNELLFKIIVESYLRFSPVNSSIYNLFSQNDYLLFILKNKNIEDCAKNNLLQHISIMFNYDKDLTTIIKVIHYKNEKLTLEIIRYYWQIYSENKNFKNKINILWSEIYNIYIKYNTKESQNIFAKLYQWAVTIDGNKIENDKKKFLSATATAIKDPYDIYNFINELNRLVEIDAKFIGNLLLKIVKKSFHHFIKIDEIKNIVKKVYASEKQIAMRINNICCQKGQYFLTDICQ